jgi:carnitine O-acetyltransferase
LAYYRMFGTIRATYEPLSMRSYRHGRTETIRVVSNESKKFVESMDNTSLTLKERVTVLKEAANQHVKYIKSAIKGDACDRHLWGLRKCIQSNESVPLIFQDSTYWSTCNWHISTSNLSNDLFDGWGWGEVVSDGLGVAYSTNSSVLLYNVTSARGFSKSFCQHIEQALLDMCLICSSHSKM